MSIKKWIPWNWFKKEEEEPGKSVPVQRQSSEDQGMALRNTVEQFHREVDRLFDDALRGMGRLPFSFNRTLLPSLRNGVLKPTLDLGATEKEYTVTVEIPGVSEKDVELEIVNDTLTIRGEKKQENEEKNKSYYRMERSYGSFQRMLSLPEDADQNGVAATFNNGILTVTMPRKLLPKAEVKRIAVKSA
jgi:HSP20 family protein